MLLPKPIDLLGVFRFCATELSYRNRTLISIFSSYITTVQSKK